MKRLRTRYLLIITGISLLVIFFCARYLIIQYTSGNRTAEEGFTDVTQDEDKKLSSNNNYRNAVEAYKRGDFKAAIDELHEETRKDTSHAQAYFLLGYIYETIEFPEGKYYSKMIDNYEKYIELKPTGKRNRYVKMRVAQYYVQNGLKQQDIRLLDKAEKLLLSLNQLDGSVRMALGAIYLNKENYDKAILEFEKSANLPPTEIKLKYNSMGLAYIKKGLYAKARNYLEIAVKIDPRDKYAHNNLGFVYAQQGELAVAKTHFVKALELDSSYENAKKNLRWVEKELSK